MAFFIGNPVSSVAGPPSSVVPPIHPLSSVVPPMFHPSSVAPMIPAGSSLTGPSPVPYSGGSVIQPRPVDQGFGPFGTQASGGQMISNPDHAHATNVINHLMAALSAARDPELKTSLSTALAALQKHVASVAKEHQQALQGKFSPRLMSAAYSNGPAHSGGSVL